MEKRIRLGAVVLTEHDRSLAHQLFFEEQWMPDRVLHELECREETIHANRDEIVHPLARRGAVPRRTQLVQPLQVRFLIGYRAICLEEHVFVEVG